MKKSTTFLKSKAKSATAEELDQIFDEGKEDITDYVDLSELQRPNLELRRVSVDMPVSMIRRIDRAAQLRGMSRQSLIKAILFEVIEEAGMTHIYDRLKKERERLEQVYSSQLRESAASPLQEFDEAFQKLEKLIKASTELSEKIKRIESAPRKIANKRLRRAKD